MICVRGEDLLTAHEAPRAQVFGQLDRAGQTRHEGRANLMKIFREIDRGAALLRRK